MTLNDLLEGKGSQVMEFADYLGTIKVKDQVMSSFKRLGKQLFQDGWTFHSDKNSPRFVKEDDQEASPGGGWAISLPQQTDGGVRAGIVDALWSGMKLNHKQEWQMCVYRYRESAEGIVDRWKLEPFKQFLYQAAKPLS
jgi:hypothetical protein